MPGEGFVGANVTIPHKLAALEIADSATDVAQRVGAANTLLFADGRIEADNTDVAGLEASLAERAPGAPQGMRCLVLGAGGAGRAAVYALLLGGAGSVTVWNRTPERAGELVQSFRSEAASTGSNGRRTRCIDLRPDPERDLRRHGTTRRRSGGRARRRFLQGAARFRR